MDVKLRECPFCGSEAYIYKDRNGVKVEDMSIEAGVMYFVMCSECSALVSGRTGEEAVGEWNRRYADAE